MLKQAVSVELRNMHIKKPLPIFPAPKAAAGLSNNIVTRINKSHDGAGKPLAAMPHRRIRGFGVVGPAVGKSVDISEEQS